VTLSSPSYSRSRRPPTLIGVGGIAWSGDPGVMYSTLLGSCIAVCLYDPMRGTGGLNHYLLAKAPPAEETDTRYGTISLPLLVNNLCAVGCQRDRLQAIVAGGANILSNIHPIGSENSDYAIQWLRSENIEIIKKDIGSNEARRVRFHPSSGECEIIHVQAPN